jgi:hypothetical protein
MDAEMARRIRDLHAATISWWGCVVRRTCLTCRTDYPCRPLLSLEARLFPGRARTPRADRCPTHHCPPDR